MTFPSTNVFGRLFSASKVPPHTTSDDLLACLGKSMLDPTGPVSGESTIPAGYTYFAQFVDHDVSLDVTSRLLQDNDPEETPNNRTPRLDLDSLYGDGPRLMPFLYASDGARLRVGQGSDMGGDLPRTSPEAGEPRLALIGDPRNDENLIISQLHLAFARFHNRVVQVLHEQDHLQGPELLTTAMQTVRWHYQWVVVHDLLKKVIRKDVLCKVLRPVPTELPFAAPDGHPPKVIVPVPAIHCEFFDIKGELRVPVEFSVAAYRFGHSMIRAGYVLQRPFPKDTFDPLDADNDLHGFRERPPDTHITEWDLLFFGRTPSAHLQFARRINPQLASVLGSLPAEVAGEPLRSLPVLDLQRGRALGLPTGQDVASFIGLGDADIVQAVDFTDIPSDGELAPYREKTPLWYYCLEEARRFGDDGNCLGPLAGTIVAEVLLGLCAADPSSFVHAKDVWVPETRFGAQFVTVEDHTEILFGMPELMAFATADSLR